MGTNKPNPYEIKDTLAALLAWLLPRRVVAWAVIRVWRDVCGNTEVPGDVPVFEALERWNVRLDFKEKARPEFRIIPGGR